MTMKDKLLFVWVLLVLVFGFFFSHFWSCTVYMLQKAVALGLFPLLALSNLAAGIAGVHFAS